ncbi:MAG TPA: valine--tRNA ligase [Candidatus Binatia bacterium]|nr:valine--tRNA ligase [Candidatus Binatia bacterium]
MSLNRRYDPSTIEPELAEKWREDGVYHFNADSDRPVFSIDTPPPTVSGGLHLGHAFSYSHTDFIARFWRMRGYNIYYPMGFDDNGLPTERLVERAVGARAEQIEREAFIDRCIAISQEFEAAYEGLFSRLGLSVDWRYAYRTYAPESRRLAQWSFSDLFRRGLVYRRRAPVIWCPTCHTAIAQAEVDDLQRESAFYTLAFRLDSGEILPIATTRPELLPACVAIFLHPDDPRASDLLQRRAEVPLFGQQVPILADEAADPHKGTGIVMCCTFGDTADVEWWYKHELALIEAIGPQGTMLAAAGPYAGLPVEETRRKIVSDLAESGKLLRQEQVDQNVRVHERCDTPIEFVVSRQWFVSLLPSRESLQEAGNALHWHPSHMKARYEQWLQSLGWDWCISRQRTFGVPFPLWYCDECGEVLLAPEDALPVDPRERPPDEKCPHCGCGRFTPETDVMDTWATSSLSPQIAGRMFAEPSLYEKVFPYSLRPQAHEIIRTWALYTVAKSQFHFRQLPWRHVAISGWGLAPQGTGKISKSRGGGPLGFMETIERYSADAVRYWAASTGFGKDTVIDERKIQAGAKLVTKLWNVARFSQRFLRTSASEQQLDLSSLTPADRWILSRSQRLIQRVTSLMEGYDYATAKSEIESFFWTEFAGNYLEMAKKRLYDGGEAACGAQETLRAVLLSTLKLLAPFLPYVTDTIYNGLWPAEGSLHRSPWPDVEMRFVDKEAESIGETLVAIAAAARRHKSESNMSLGAELRHLHLTIVDAALAQRLRQAEPDLISITRAQKLSVGNQDRPDLLKIGGDDVVGVSVAV